MPALRDLIEVYGALDQAVLQSDDPAVAETVEQYLPNASKNPGWYRELEGYFFGDKARSEANLDDALARIAADSKAGSKLTAPQKSRLHYGIYTATKVKQMVPSCSLPSPEDTSYQSTLVDALTAAGPADESYESRRAAAEALLPDLTDQVHNTFQGRNDFQKVKALCADRSALDQSTLRVPLCKSAIVTVNGYVSVVVDTELSSPHISVKNLKAIVNPFNWDENYPDFFIKMSPSIPVERTDGWRRVVETVGFRDLGGRWLTTALKYLPSPEGDDGSARIDYDLDDPKPNPGDGKVLVDRGYINMWPATPGRPDEPGVRVRTRKVVHITGLSPYAQRQLVCLSGYGTASSEFLLGPARDPNPDARHFDYYDHEPPEQDDDPEVGTSNHVGTTAVHMWTDAVAGMTSDYFDLAQKWLQGSLTGPDLAAYSKDLAGRLAGAPWEFLDRINRPRYPGGGPGGTQGGGAR